MSRGWTDLILQASTVLDELGPFPANAPREQKWRTTEQLAYILRERFDPKVTLDALQDALALHESTAIDRLRAGRSPEALIRRATYPDRTTALPLWGSTKHHGQARIDQPGQLRADIPEELPAELRLDDLMPAAFLSHAHHDSALAYRVAQKLASMGTRPWMFETDIEYRGPIAACVRNAIDSAACCLALVTRDSIASLWVLTELHTALAAGKPITLIINVEDALLLTLLQSVEFHHPGEKFDLSVTYDGEPVEVMAEEFGARQGSSRAARYRPQVHDFLASLPAYLAGQPALAFPAVPPQWKGPIPLAPFDALRPALPAGPLVLRR